MRLHRSILILVLVTCSISNVVLAASDANSSEFDAIRAQQAEIRNAVIGGEARYGEMSAQTLSILLERQAALLRLIEGKRSSAELNEQEQRELSSSLEWIRTTLAKAEDDRLVCENRKMLGSNRRERVCVTVRQQREQREAARRELESGDM